MGRDVLKPKHRTTDRGMRRNGHEKFPTHSCLPRSYEHARRWFCRFRGTKMKKDNQTQRVYRAVKYVYLQQLTIHHSPVSPLIQCRNILRSFHLHLDTADGRYVLASETPL
ncbi:hypothetical protein GE061_017528 [Apolygus lucorum]|uniref:Uncharacterized protein n=1 Tax=Apolygus lucorum TaxID=248454 RepID=A0A8S9XDE0_APOLU|nr:hypothetical protein GE061_017528 [Apolygus lucorum]